jgi:hypothetical protein
MECEIVCFVEGEFEFVEHMKKTILVTIDKYSYSLSHFSTAYQ